MTHYALFSGGHDSLVSTHIAMEKGPAEQVVHMDTNTGLPENKEYVREVCEMFDWDLRIMQADMTLKEFGVRYGFPGPGSHSWAYRYFKKLSLEQIKKEDDEDPHFWTGVRMDESERRMENISETGVVEVEPDRERWVWHKPLAYMTEEQCEEYIARHSLPRSPVVEKIHRSGDCFCGAFHGRDETLIDLMAHYPKHADYIKETENEVLEESDVDEEYCVWAHGSESSMRLRMLIDAKAEDPDLMLCSDCTNDAMEEDW